MSLLDTMLNRLSHDVQDIQDGLDPKVLEAWYAKVVSDAREMAPSWLAGKINVKQDPVLLLKFKLGISKRAVRYFMASVEANFDSMPYTTRLYFIKVQELIESEMDKELV